VIKDEHAEIKKKYATPRRTTIIDAAPGEAEAPITSADLAVPEEAQMVTLTTAGIMRGNASAYSYRVQAGASSRAVTAHRMRVQAEPTDKVFFVASNGHAWSAPVGQVPQKAELEDLGLKGEEQIVHSGILSGEGFLVLGTAQGRIKRAEMTTLVDCLPDGVWTEVIGLNAGDRVVFAGVCGEKGEVLFFTDSRLLRITADTVRNQPTPSARGVIGIKLREGDKLLGGAVVSDPKDQQVFILSEKGYLKRVPIDEFSVQGRGSLGVLGLNATKATGPIVAAAIGKPGRSTTVDILAADGKRQRLSCARIPVENRPNRGRKLGKLAQANEIVVLE
jgi:DNA gyrase subunit A